MKPKYIQVQSDEFETVTEYQALDGKIFSDLRETLEYEADLKFEAVEKTSFWFPMIDDTWYKAKDEQELKFLIEHLSTNYGGKRYGTDKLKVGEWFTVVHKDRDGTNTSADHFVALSKLRDSYRELLEFLGEQECP